MRLSGKLSIAANAARWAVRTAGDPTKFAGPIRAEIARFDPNFLITEMQPMEALVERAQAKTRFSLQLIGHPFAEATVYRAAEAYEAATGWASRRPPGL